MQKVKWIALLAVVCFCAMSITAYAQLSTANWPVLGRDCHNSSHSPATAIAKPVVKFQQDLDGGPQGFCAATPTGLSISPNGTVFANDWYDTEIAMVTSTNVKTFSNPTYACNVGFLGGGITFFDDGTDQYALFQQQWDGYPANFDGRRIFYLNALTGAQIRYTDPACTESVVGQSNGWNSYSNLGVGPDGTIYYTGQRSAAFATEGPTYAYDKNGNRKWMYNANGVGESYGAPAIKVGEDGKNRIYLASGVYQWKVTQDGIQNILALRDDGTSATLLWSKQTGFGTSMPVLSDDGSALYVAGRENWPLAGWATQSGRAIPDGTLTSYNADTGAKNWSINTGGRHAYSPALGPGNMIYVCGGYIKGWWNTHTSSSQYRDCPLLTTPGKLIAVKDNGGSAEIKWTLPLPDDEASETTTVVTISTTPTTMYVASSSGRVYCVQDMGDYAKILWTYFGQAPKFNHRMRHAVPANLVVADDGTLYMAINIAKAGTPYGKCDRLYAFDSTSGGFDPSDPIGISGTVKDAAGNPIAGAWVAASTTAKPLADNGKTWTRTDAEGKYQLTPLNTGTYYVAAAAEGYGASDDLTAAFATATTVVSGKDFTLGVAKLNRCVGATATCTTANGSYPASNAVDGSDITRFASTGTSAELIIDLGTPRTISEAVIKWWYFYGTSYRLDYSDDGSTWSTTPAYSTTTGNGGFPLSFYPSDPTVAGPPYADGTNVNIGGPKLGVDIFKTVGTTAPHQYWKVSYTAAACLNTDTFNRGIGQAAGYASIWEVELRDATKNGPVPSTIGAARNADDGDGVAIASAVVTAMPGAGLAANNVCIESADRSAGIKVNVSGVSGLNLATLGFGDKVSVAGKVQSSNGEKYIAAIAFNRISSGAPVVALGINNRDMDTAKGQGLFVKTWGKVTDNTVAGEFTITDGSTNAVKVLCGSLTKPSIDAVVKVRGVAGKDASGTILYMRNEQSDLTTGDAEYQTLPLPGPYKYPREYAVCGPFSDAGSTDQTYRLDHDFISDATSGALTEATIQPNVGDACGTNTWVKADASSDTLNFLSYGGTNNCTFYAHLWIYSPIDQWVCMRVGNDDSAKVFVNGAQVGSGAYTASFCGNLFDAGGSTIELTPGFNSVLYKVENATSAFGLNSQFVPWDAPGVSGYGGASPVLGLSYTLIKP